MATPRVAILIVAYNSERYIVQTLRNCAAQTYSNLEIVVLDNASTDGTVNAIQSITDPKIRLLKSPDNLGPYAGLNFLLDRVEADYIAIQDHDDLWLPDKIRQQVDFLETHHDHIACGTRAWYFHEQEKLLMLTDNYSINGYPDHTSLLFRNQGFRYEPQRSLPDEYFQAQTLRHKGLIGCIPDGLSIHRIRGDRGNLSSLRSRWNFSGAWEHLRNTKYRDILGTMSMLVATVLPRRFIWWSRRQVTYRKLPWLSQSAFEAKFGFRLSDEN